MQPSLYPLCSLPAPAASSACSTGGHAVYHLSLLLLLLPAPSSPAAPPAHSGFSTGGHTVYHLRPATVQKGEARAVVAAAFDGYVLCYQPDGRRLWKAPTGGHMPFDLAAADIDGDRLDETLVASADGSLYAI